MSDTAAAPPRLLTDAEPALLSRVEDAGLNASAPPQQLWLDGWLVRFSPGKAQRARCVNALAVGRRPVAEKLRECRALFREQGLPFLVRLTPFTQPNTLDADLVEQGFEFHDDTRVMVRTSLPSARSTPNWPASASLRELSPDAFAEAVGELRGSPPPERKAHARRLRESPVQYRGFVLLDVSGHSLACAQIAQEGPLVGLYDVATAQAARRQGLASLLCEHLLGLAASQGASTGYLQVGADNTAARSIYGRMGFVDAYTYHYRREAAAQG